MSTLRNPTYHRRREQRLRFDEQLREQRLLATAMAQMQARTAELLNQRLANLMAEVATRPLGTPPPTRTH